MSSARTRQNYTQMEDPLFKKQGSNHSDYKVSEVSLGKKYRMCLVVTCVSLFVWIAFYLPIQYGLQTWALPTYHWMIEQKDLQRYILPNNQTVILNPQVPCPPSLFLVVVVCSSITNFDSRKAIRETWAKSSLWFPNVRIVFLLGSSHNETLDAKVLNESLQYSDIIQEDFVDVYNNLTLKSVMMLKWVNNFCRNAKYVLKTDDDMFVHIPNLLKYLQSNGTSHLFAGCLIKNATPVKDWTSKWYVPNEIYPFRKYPDYLSGTGYVMSGNIIPKLYAAALRANFFYLEDIFLTGICAQKIGIKPTNHKGFSYVKRSNNPCIFRNIITAHRMTTDELYGIWLKIHNSSIHC